MTVSGPPSTSLPTRHDGRIEGLFADSSMSTAHARASLIASRAVVATAPSTPRARRRGARPPTPTRATQDDSCADERSSRRDVSARASGPRGGASVSAASTVDSDAHTEPYSFFNLATAEFPSDWTSPTARAAASPQFFAFSAKLLSMVGSRYVVAALPKQIESEWFGSKAGCERV